MRARSHVRVYCTMVPCTQATHRGFSAPRVSSLCCESSIAMNVFLATLALTSHRQLMSCGDLFDMLLGTQPEGLSAAQMDSACKDPMLGGLIEQLAPGTDISLEGVETCDDLKAALCDVLGPDGGNAPEVPDDTEEDDPEEDGKEDGKEDGEEDTVPFYAVLCPENEADPGAYCDCSGDCTATESSYCGCDEAVACCAANDVRAPHHPSPAPEAADPRPRPADPRPRTLYSSSSCAC